MFKRAPESLAMFPFLKHLSNEDLVQYLRNFLPTFITYVDSHQISRSSTDAVSCLLDLISLARLAGCERRYETKAINNPDLDYHWNGSRTVYMLPIEVPRLGFRLYVSCDLALFVTKSFIPAKLLVGP